jgi:hypothetical protein
LHPTILMIEQLTCDMTSAQEELDAASAAMDAIVREIESLERDHSKQKVSLIHPVSDI